MNIFDKSVRPQDDFYSYVNNDWLTKTPIPANENAWGTFYVLNEQSTQYIKKIINEIINAPESNLSANQKVLKNFFTTSYNFQKFKNNHITTINNEIEKIKQLSTFDELIHYIGYSHSRGIYPFWNCYVDSDDKNSKSHVLRIQQAGIILPNRDYYFENSSKMKSIRKKYQEYFQTAISFIPSAKSLDFNTIYKIEYQLAKSSWTDVQLRDAIKCYNKFSIVELSKRFSNINWKQYFAGLDWKIPTDNIVINQLSFIDDVIKMFDTFSVAQLKQYLIWKFINNFSGWISTNSAKNAFNFYGKVLTGREKMNPTWKRTIYLTDDLMIGELLGREYSERHFPKSSKQAVLNIVEDIRTAYHKRINDNQWMTPKTKKRAHIKLDNTRVFIGYPPVWHDFSNLKPTGNNHIENILRANEFDNYFNLSKIGKQPEAEDWHMFPHVVNAYYDPNQLVICFPAAILKKPFYDPGFDYATNMGGIGTVIGHEFTHGFDDQGSGFDEFGNIANWQIAKEKASFNQLSKSIIKQADEFEVAPGIFHKGKLVIGEAIADIGGVELAIEALTAKSNGKNLKKDIQKLLINYTICERTAYRNEYLLEMAKTDPHPVSRFRVNCTLSHINAFYDTYHVTPEDKLYLPPEKRAHIW